MPQRHVVASGECLSSIAKRYGFSDYKAIFDHPDNAELKQKRKDPAVIHPGDVLVVPDKAEKQAEIATGSLHKFKLKTARTMTRIALKLEGKFGYELTIDGEKHEGKTDGSSPIEHDIPADARDGELLLWPDTDGNDEAREGLQRIPLLFGHLDPLDEVSGVQGVLANLGFYFGPLDGRESEDTRSAVRAFQKAAGLEPTGTIDDTLRDKLRGEHDG